jgi:hypothetical protein
METPLLQDSSSDRFFYCQVIEFATSSLSSDRFCFGFGERQEMTRLLRRLAAALPWAASALSWSHENATASFVFGLFCFVESQK